MYKTNHNEIIFYLFCCDERKQMQNVSHQTMAKGTSDSQWTANEQPMRQIISYYLPVIEKHTYMYTLFITCFQ